MGTRWTLILVFSSSFFLLFFFFNCSVTASSSWAPTGVSGEFGGGREKKWRPCFPPDSGFIRQTRSSSITTSGGRSTACRSSWRSSPKSISTNASRGIYQVSNSPSPVAAPLLPGQPISDSISGIRRLCPSSEAPFQAESISGIIPLMGRTGRGDPEQRGCLTSQILYPFPSAPFLRPIKSEAAMISSKGKSHDGHCVGLQSSHEPNGYFNLFGPVE